MRFQVGVKHITTARDSKTGKETAGYDEPIYEDIPDPKKDPAGFKRALSDIQAVLKDALSRLKDGDPLKVKVQALIDALSPYQGQGMTAANFTLAAWPSTAVKQAFDALDGADADGTIDFSEIRSGDPSSTRRALGMYFEDDDNNGVREPNERMYQIYQDTQTGQIIVDEPGPLPGLSTPMSLDAWKKFQGDHHLVALEAANDYSELPPELSRFIDSPDTASLTGALKAEVKAYLANSVANLKALKAALPGMSDQDLARLFVTDTIDGKSESSSGMIRAAVPKLIGYVQRLETTDPKAYQDLIVKNGLDALLGDPEKLTEALLIDNKKARDFGLAARIGDPLGFPPDQDLTLEQYWISVTTLATPLRDDIEKSIDHAIDQLAGTDPDSLPLYAFTPVLDHIIAQLKSREDTNPKIKAAVDVAEGMMLDLEKQKSDYERDRQTVQLGLLVVTLGMQLFPPAGIVADLLGAGTIFVAGGDAVLSIRDYQDDVNADNLNAGSQTITEMPDPNMGSLVLSLAGDAAIVGTEAWKLVAAPAEYAKLSPEAKEAVDLVRGARAGDDYPVMLKITDGAGDVRVQWVPHASLDSGAVRAAMGPGAAKVELLVTPAEAQAGQAIADDLGRSGIQVDVGVVVDRANTITRLDALDLGAGDTIKIKQVAGPTAGYQELTVGKDALNHSFQKFAENIAKGGFDVLPISDGTENLKYAFIHFDPRIGFGADREFLKLVVNNADKLICCYPEQAKAWLVRFMETEMGMAPNLAQMRAESMVVGDWNVPTVVQVDPAGKLYIGPRLAAGADAASITLGPVIDFGKALDGPPVAFRDFIPGDPLTRKDFMAWFMKSFIPEGITSGGDALKQIAWFKKYYGEGAREVLRAFSRALQGGGFEILSPEERLMFVRMFQAFPKHDTSSLGPMFEAAQKLFGAYTGAAPLSADEIATLEGVLSKGIVKQLGELDSMWDMPAAS